MRAVLAWGRGGNEGKGTIYVRDWSNGSTWEVVFYGFRLGFYEIPHIFAIEYQGKSHLGLI